MAIKIGFATGALASQRAILRGNQDTIRNRKAAAIVNFAVSGLFIGVAGHNLTVR